MQEIAEFIGERDGVRYYRLGEHELSEAQLQQHMSRRHESERALDEWKRDTEPPQYDPSAWALRRLERRGIYEPTEEQLLREIEHVQAHPPTAEEIADGN